VTSIDNLAELMVGRKVNFIVEKKSNQVGREILRVEKLVAKDHRGVNVVNGVDLSVYAGEIVGIAGVDGNGQSELVEVLTGLRKPVSGKIELIWKISKRDN